MTIAFSGKSCRKQTRNRENKRKEKESKAINLVILREDNNTVWRDSVSAELFPFLLEDMFRLWLKRIQDEDSKRIK